MEVKALEVSLTGGLRSIMHDPRYFQDYYRGKLTADGERAVIDLVNLFGDALREAERQDLDSRAKAMVVDHLRGK